MQGWQRDAWRFLYKNRLEGLHWAVLEQDHEIFDSFFRIVPDRIQAWREVNELTGRTLMRGGAWLS